MLQQPSATWQARILGVQRRNTPYVDHSWMMLDVTAELAKEGMTQTLAGGSGGSFAAAPPSGCG